ncbi:MBL fold metallo-hydrolase [Timonella sp. A28]|uniref:MBL fold metallo-hydrolase n=1 Tax=Timonella sp. A28 TaxID=3442640 RepID=UPI003EB6CEE3
MKLTVVGMSGSYAGPQSPASCYLVQATDPNGREWSIVLDLGSGAFGALQRHIDPFDVDALAITHLHPDHCSDLSGYYVYYKYHPQWGTEFSDRNPIPVFAPTDAADRFAVAYGLEDGESMDTQFTHVPWKCGSTVTVGPFTIDVHEVNHPVEAYGFRISGPSEHDPSRTVVLGYSGDTDDCQGVRDIARNADVFLCEAAFLEGRDDGIVDLHLTGKRAARIATDSKAKRLILTHIPSWNDPEITRAEARNEYAGETHIAEPGTTYSF